MLRNYIVIALRNIRRNKVYSLINVFGLSVGLTCCLLLALYVKDELSYDKHHDRVQDLYRVITRIDGLERVNPSTSPPVAAALQQEIPEVEFAARLITPLSGEPNLIAYEDRLFYEHDGYIADAAIFDILTYAFVQGNAHKALVHPNSVVITEQLARKLFGQEQALDKTISIQGVVAGDFKITGVIRDDFKSYIHASFIASANSSGGWAEYLQSDHVRDEWGGQNFAPTLLKLSPGHNKDAVAEKMNEVLQKHGADDLKALGMNKTLALEPVKDIYLRSEVDRSPRIVYLYVVGSIAVFILLIACINFMNLSTARATKRAGEIGLRKVMGAYRSSLIGQMMGEAMVIVLFSIALGVMMIHIVLPYFNMVTGKSISFGAGNFLFAASALAVIALVTALVAGSYPAFYLSSLQPARVLKGKLMADNASGRARQLLVVFQFVITITLTSGMIIVSRQLEFIQEKNLGFDSEARIVLPLRSLTAGNNYKSLRNELSGTRGVEHVSGANYLPGSVIFSDLRYYMKGGTMDNAIRHVRNTVDYGFLELLDIPLIAGRSFTDNREMEQGKVIVNRTAAKNFGVEPDALVGQFLYSEWQGVTYTVEVIGVMEDYHQTSLHDEILPVVYQTKNDLSGYDFMIASLHTGDLDETVGRIEKAWKNLNPDTPFEYSFLDENIQKQYLGDQKMSAVISAFTLIAMLISCLGLYGLSSYMAEKRFKEIGIRKALGASVRQIVKLMSGEFIRLIVVALVLSIPVAWYAMAKWLEEFVYKVSVDVSVFLYAGIAALLLALVTVSFEAVKAASMNPVNALKND